MPNEAVKRALPGSYSEMYPSRFLKADMLKGRKITMTIKAIFGEDLTDADENSKAEWIVQFAERPFEWVMNKTGAYCLYRMFGGDPHTWSGHKITLFPQPGTWFGEKGEAIRVWGSPELTEDLPITLKFLRKKKDRNMVMHKVTAARSLSRSRPSRYRHRGPFRLPSATCRYSFCWAGTRTYRIAGSRRTRTWIRCSGPANSKRNSTNSRTTEEKSGDTQEWKTENEPRI